MYHSMTRRSLLPMIAATLSFGRTSNLTAHGLHAAFTLIDIDPTTEVWRVVHRMFTQDVGTLIKARTNDGVAVGSGASFEAAMESYIKTAFTFRDGNGTVLPLAWSHASIGDDVVAIYFSGERQTPIRRFIVDSQLLMETNPDQVNTVNLTLNDITRTAVFRDGDKPQLLTF